ncbi:MAG: hypothetical protein NTZ78_09645 [Candidatus Aureabacteria bacterium]|nr:hypothetical protein [Candidatus Auribacterota bacterium]
MVVLMGDQQVLVEQEPQDKASMVAMEGNPETTREVGAVAQARQEKPREPVTPPREMAVQEPHIRSRAVLWFTEAGAVVVIEIHPLPVLAVMVRVMALIALALLQVESPTEAVEAVGAVIPGGSKVLAEPADPASS